MFGRVVPTTDFPILFLVSDIIDKAILDGRLVVVRGVVVLKELDEKKAVVVEETIRVAIKAALIVNIVR